MPAPDLDTLPPTSPSSPTASHFFSPLNAGSVPNPDPTQRTIEQLQREIGAIRQILEANITGTRQVLETRLFGMDKAIELLQLTSNKLPEQIKNEVTQLRQLHDEKFHSIDIQLVTRFEGIDKQFSERDKRTEQLSLADKTAIAAALQAQKEAAGAQNDSNSTANTKMEANFAKLIEQTQQLLQEVRRNTDDKINDIKLRQAAGDGGVSGGRQMISDNRATVGTMLGVGGMAVSFITMLVLIASLLMGHQNGNYSSGHPASIAVTPISPSALKQ